MGLRVLKTPALSATALAVLAVVGAACGRSQPDPAPAPAPSAQPEAAASATLDRIKQRKRLHCGVADNAPGFSERGLTGQWRGFDVDICRAVAAAVLGDARAVTLTGLTSRTRFAALQSGAVDLVAGGASYTFTHDAVLGLQFAGVSYYDSQGFLTSAPKPPRRARGAKGPLPEPPVKTIADLNGLRICVQGGSAAQQGLAEGLRARGLSYQPIVKDDRQQALEAYQRHQCDAITDDLSVLAYDRSALRGADQHVILAETLNDEPLGPVVREGDDRWLDVVRWTLNAMILAEGAKVQSATVEQMRNDTVDPGLRRLLGVEGDAGRPGPGAEWGFKVIRQVGAYDEVFDRNLGQATALKLERGRNALATATPPGQLYAPPLR